MRGKRFNHEQIIAILKEVETGIARPIYAVNTASAAIHFTPGRLNTAVLQSTRPGGFGCPRLHIMLRREGFMINHKRTERIYKQQGLMLRIRRRKKLSSLLRTKIPKPKTSNYIWSMDFMRDNLADGRTIKVLSVVDEWARKCFKIEVDTSINGTRVSRVLTEIGQTEGLPEITINDNGSEFISSALDSWAYQRGVKLTFIRPGKPVENAYIESFNGWLRDECLNENWFLTLEHARGIIEKWRMDYNNARPHSSLGYLTPEEFIRLGKWKKFHRHACEGRND